MIYWSEYQMILTFMTISLNQITFGLIAMENIWAIWHLVQFAKGEVGELFYLQQLLNIPDTVLKSKQWSGNMHKYMRLFFNFPHCGPNNKWVCFLCDYIFLNALRVTLLSFSWLDIYGEQSCLQKTRLKICSQDTPRTAK